jgi:hypothetical protein
MDVQAAINDIIKGNVATKIGNATETDQSTVEKVVVAGLPIILGQMGNNTATTSGAEKLDAAVEKDHMGGSLLESLSGLFAGGDSSGDGSKILDHVFGNKIPAAAEQVATKTGLDTATVVKILTFLAPLVMAYLGKKKADGGLDAGGLSDLLKKQKTNDGSPLTQLATAMLDKNGDGSVVDDILGGFLKKS